MNTAKSMEEEKPIIRLNNDDVEKISWVTKPVSQVLDAAHGSTIPDPGGDNRCVPFKVTSVQAGLMFRDSSGRTTHRLSNSVIPTPKRWPLSKRDNEYRD